MRKSEFLRDLAFACDAISMANRSRLGDPKQDYLTDSEMRAVARDHGLEEDCYSSALDEALRTGSGKTSAGHVVAAFEKAWEAHEEIREQRLAADYARIPKDNFREPIPG